MDLNYKDFRQSIIIGTENCCHSLYVTKQRKLLKNIVKH